MAFPQTAAPTPTAIATNPTTHAVNKPAGVIGDLLVAGGSLEVSGTLTDPSDWTKIYDSSGVRCIYARKLTGTEAAGTFNVTTTGAGNSAWHCYKIPAASWWGDIATGIAVAIGVSANDVPALTHGWGVVDALWLAWFFMRNDNEAATTYPTNYSNGVSTAAGGPANDSASIASARRELAAASDDPDSFVADDAATHHTVLIAIRPAAGGGGGGGSLIINRRRRG